MKRSGEADFTTSLALHVGDSVLSSDDFDGLAQLQSGDSRFQWSYASLVDSLDVSGDGWRSWRGLTEACCSCGMVVTSGIEGRAGGGVTGLGFDVDEALVIMYSWLIRLLCWLLVMVQILFCQIWRVVGAPLWWREVVLRWIWLEMMNGLQVW